MAGRSVRKQAADAAFKLLQTKVDLVSDLAEAGGDIDAAERAVEEAQQALAATQAAYMDKYRAAIAGGWSDDELTRVGCSAERGGQATGPRRRTRRRAAAPPQQVTEQQVTVAPAEAGNAVAS
jgi:hypothetical protein